MEVIWEGDGGRTIKFDDDRDKQKVKKELEALLRRLKQMKSWLILICLTIQERMRSYEIIAEIFQEEQEKKNKKRTAKSSSQAVEKISTALFFSLNFPLSHFIIEKSILKEGVFLMFHTRNSSQHEAEFVC